ncbi:MAG: metal ABC transporter permease [Spirochaetales bacterium]|nr:metal ABC transporter permease [Spirochaetales bacterium]
MGFLTKIFGDFTIAVVALGSGILGFVAGSLGSFAVLRKQSLLGDSISHAALPGIILAFILTGTKAALPLVIGAAIAGWIGTLFILSIVKNTRIDTDSAQGIVLSVFFGLGLVLFSFVQSSDSAEKAGLDKIIFGQAATLLVRDVIVMALFGFAALVLMVLFWKEFKLMTFDREFGESLGFSAVKTDFLLTALIVIAIVIGLQTVGVILMSAMIIAPAAAARQWTDKLAPMVFLAGITGALSGISGVIIESRIPNLATGPTIILSLTTLTVLSIFFAPKRGVAAKMARRLQNRYHFSRQQIIVDLYRLEEQHSGEKRYHDIVTIGLAIQHNGNLKTALKMLARQGILEQDRKNSFSLSEKGREEAGRLLAGGSVWIS